MKKILVTGGAGFLGSHLCNRLIKEGNNVTCLDNYFTGSKKNINNLINNKLFKIINHDIIDPFYAEFDEIYNLACPASPVHYQYNPIQTMKTSVIGCINILELAKTEPKFYKPAQVKYMVIQLFILSLSHTGEMLIQLVLDLVMMKVKDVRKPYLWIIIFMRK